MLALCCDRGMPGVPVTTRPSTVSRPRPSGLGEKIALAAELFASRGVDATRVDEIARVTGVPRATLYYYFAGKERILAHLLDSTLSALADRLDAAASGDASGRDRLERVIREHLAFIGSQRATYQMLFAELGRATSLVDVASGVDRAIKAPLRKVLHAGQVDGTLYVPDIAVAASVVHGAVLVNGREQAMFPEDPDHVDAVVAVIFRGLGADPITRRSSSGLSTQGGKP